MTKEEINKELQEALKELEELEEEKAMKQAGMMNPPSACGREEDRFGK